MTDAPTVEPMARKERFSVEPMARKDPLTDAYWIKDNEAPRFRMPERAVSMNMRHLAAVKMAVLLNDEWAAFVRNPT